VGQLHSATGTMAISETGSIQAERLAIDQINEMGGLLGRKIKITQEDGASDWPTFAEKAKKLLVNDKVAAIMGCWTSASRKAVLPVVEQYNGMLYYPTFYEGLEQSKNVIYTGQEATQQILAGLNWIAKEKGAKSFFFIGSDYIWPRTSNKIARKHVENVLKGKVVGEEYYALGSTQFNSVINKIKLTKPDVIFTDVVGGSNVAFYKQLKAAGVDLSKQALLTISVTEDEIDGIGGENIAGAEVIADALRGFLSDDVWGSGRRLLRVAGAPVLSKNRDRIVGALVIGADTSQQFAERLKKNLDVDVALLLRGKVLASTVEPTTLGTLPDLVTQHRSEIEEAKRTLAIPINVGSDTYLAVAAPFPGQASQQDGYYVLIGKKPARADLSALLASTSAKTVFIRVTWASVSRFCRRTMRRGPSQR
jgi:hypothetical protein